MWTMHVVLKHEASPPQTNAWYNEIVSPLIHRHFILSNCFKLHPANIGNVAKSKKTYKVTLLQQTRSSNADFVEEHNAENRRTLQVIYRLIV